jgi:hypothetical protein
MEIIKLLTKNLNPKWIEVANVRLIRITRCKGWSNLPLAISNPFGIVRKERKPQ